jgi:hypothetical protein
MKRASDVLIVAADKAYPEYVKYQAYIGHPNRSFRQQVRWMAFYTAKAIQREVPAILEVRHGLTFSRETISQLYSTGNDADRDLADLIGVTIEETSRVEGSIHDVLLLTSPDDPQTTKLAHKIRGTKRDHKGRPIPITMGQFRYTSMEALATGPRSTDELGL